MLNRLVPVALGLALASACSSPAASSKDAGAPSDGSAASSPDAAAVSGDGGVPSGADSSTSGEDALPSTVLPRPTPICAVPPEGQLVDTSTPRVVVGTGTPQSCTEQSLRDAIQGGGIITFDCGPAPFTLTVTSELKINNHAGAVVIDGGGKITLSGGGTSRILWLNACEDPISPRCDIDPHPALTVQRLVFRDGHSRDSVASTKAVTSGGGAIFRHGGLLTVVDCDFYDNSCDESGQDVSGGAITSQQSQLTLVVGSNFKNNACANGGALGSLQAALTVINSVLVENRATGSGGNRVPDPAHADDTGGNGGNGGAIVVDGQNNEVKLCGVTLASNGAHYAGSALFRTGYNGEPFSIQKSVVDANALDRLAWPDTDHDHYNTALGALYIQGVTAAIEQTSVTRNKSNGGAAGVFGATMGAAGGVINMTNVTIAANEVTGSGIGGALFGSGASGLLTNVTIAGNKANFGGAMVFSGGFTLKNTLVADNHRNDADSTGKWNPNSCFNGTAQASGANLQWPQTNAAGLAAEPACATGITFSDPKLGPLADHGGTGDTLVPDTAGPAAGVGTGCPAVDQRGNARNASHCMLGAVEAP